MTTRDKKILISFLGIICVVVSFLFVYQPYMEETKQIQQENEVKEKELERLKALEEQKEYFLSETEVLKNTATTYLDKFPTEVKEEDGILLVRGLEKKVGTNITSIMLSEAEFVYAEDKAVIQEENNDTTTWAEKNAEATQQQINEIEQELGGSTSTTSQNTYTGTARALYRMQSNIEFTTDYSGLKEIVQYIHSLSKRVTIETINLTYDRSKGNLIGDAVLNIFTLQGIDKAYEQPETGNISHGIDNIFGTLELENKDQ